MTNLHVAKTSVKIGGVVITVTNEADLTSLDVSVLIQNAYALYNRVCEVAQDPNAPLPERDTTIWEMANGKFEHRRAELPAEDIVSVWSHNVPLTMYALTSGRLAIATLRGAYDALSKIAPQTPQNAPSTHAATTPRMDTAQGSDTRLFSAKVNAQQGVIHVTRQKAQVAIDIARQAYDYKNDGWMIEGREYAYPVSLIKRQDNGRIMFGFANDMGIFSVFPPRPEDQYPDKVFLAADALLGGEQVMTIDNMWLAIKRKAGKNGKHYTNAVNLYAGDVPHVNAPTTPAPAQATLPAPTKTLQEEFDAQQEAPLAHDPDDIPF